MFSFVEDGTYEEEDQTFSHTKNYYRTLVYKLTFALIAMIIIYGLFTLIEWLIPDQPRHLVDRQNQIAHILSIKRFQLRQQQVNQLKSKLLRVKFFKLF